MNDENLFKDCNGIEELVGQLVGAGSMCWESVRAAGVFNAAQASRIVDDGVARLSQLLGGLP